MFLLPCSGKANGDPAGPAPAGRGNQKPLGEQIAEIETQIRSIRQEQISGDNVYQLLLTFNQLYAELTEPEKKEFMRAIIEQIDIYPEKRPDGCWIRNIVFNFPVPAGGMDIHELSLENSSILETVVLLCKT